MERLEFDGVLELEACGEINSHRGGGGDRLMASVTAEFEGINSAGNSVHLVFCKIKAIASVEFRALQEHSLAFFLLRSIIYRVHFHIVKIPSLWVKPQVFISQVSYDGLEL
jgi:hypothetical protein